MKKFLAVCFIFSAVVEASQQHITTVVGGDRFQLPIVENHFPNTGYGILHQNLDRHSPEGELDWKRQIVLDTLNEFYILNPHKTRLIEDYISFLEEMNEILNAQLTGHKRAKTGKDEKQNE